MTAESPPNKERKSRQKVGLAHWMRRVLKECDKAGQDLASDPVHDLRVALRRCRSMADGLMTMDPDKSWKQMKKASKPLFQSLGNLRDMQVMAEWVQRLGTADYPVAMALHDFITGRERELKQEALKALRAFDRKCWNLWCKELPRRAARIRLGSIVFKHLALERWMEARRLQPPALRTRSPRTLHRLRIGLKRFRYTVENFLPQLDAKWSDDLKELQDMLGEVHDLDVLWDTAIDIKAFPDEEARTRWQTRIREERRQRIEKYREKMTGNKSLWAVWRAELPQGKQIQSAALARLKIWASFLDPDFLHSQRVADLAAQLYDGLSSNGLQLHDDDQNLHTILCAAALMHDVGRSGKEKGHHKKSSRLIRRLTPPLGLTADDLNLAGVIARYHRGALPQSRHKAFASLPAEQKAKALRLAGILRFVNALDPRDASRVPRRQVRSLEVRDGMKSKDCALYVYAQGYSRYGRLAENVAAARYLLELTLRRPVIVRALNQNRTRAPYTSGNTVMRNRPGSRVRLKPAA